MSCRIAGNRAAAFADYFLHPLTSEDERRGGSLTDSLAAYLMAGSSLTEAAESLGVHRNTLTYRLNRIRELTNDDLHDPDRRFQMQIAIAAQRMLAALRAA